MYPSPPASPPVRTAGLSKRTPSPTDRLSSKDHPQRGYNRRTRTKTAELGPSKDQKADRSGGDLKQATPSYLPRRVPSNRMANRSSSYTSCTPKTTAPTQKTSRQQYSAGLSIVSPTPQRWTTNLSVSPHPYRTSSTPRQSSGDAEEATSNGPRHMAVIGRRRTTDVSMSSSSLSSSPLSSSSSAELNSSSRGPKRPYRNAPRIISYTLPPEVEMSWSSPLVSPSVNASPVFFSVPCNSVPVSTPASSHPLIRQESEAEFCLRGVLGKSDRRAVCLRPSDRRSISLRSSSSSVILSDREAEAKRKQAEKEFAEDIARWVDGAPEIPRALLSADKTKGREVHATVGNGAGWENRGRMARPSIQDRRVTAPISSFSMLRTASPAELSNPSSSSRHSSPARRSPDRSLFSAGLTDDNNNNNDSNVGLNKKRTHSTSSAHSMPFAQTPLGRSSLGSSHPTPSTPTAGLLSPPSPHSGKISLSGSIVSPSSTRFPFVESRSPALMGSAVPFNKGDPSEDTFYSASLPSSSSANSGLALPKSQARVESGFDLDQTMERCSRIEGYISFQEVGIGNIFDGDEEEDEPAEQDLGSKRGSWWGWLGGGSAGGDGGSGTKV